MASPAASASASILFVFAFLVASASTLCQPESHDASKCFYLPDIHIVGGTYDEFEAQDIRQCCIRCANHACCMAYTFDKLKQRCYMKSSISHSEERASMTSGIKANMLNGSGSRLQNVQIEGGQSSIPLKNAHECQQYCNAYGIFSWLPPRLGEEDGQCSCTNRISAIRYQYGAQSAIFPVSTDFA